VTDPTGTGPASYADDGHRYRLDSRIATGGMGEVWRASDTTLGRTVAVKLLKAEYADDATFRSRFASEAQHAAALHHPGVAAVYDFGEAATADGSPRPYLVMELVDGQPLSALIVPGQPLDPDVTRDLMGQAADAIGAAHAAGIVHRDVKPANLIVTPDRQVKITDFGIARALEGMALTQTGQVMGTPQYISPEQAQGQPATPASDVYSLGVVAFECLTSERPFVAPTPVATALAHVREPVPPLPDSVPADLAAVVTRSMAKDPADRYPDAAAFATALRDPSAAAATAVVPAAAAAAEGTTVMPAVTPAPAPTPADGTPVPPPEEEKRRPRWLWIVLAVAVLAAVIALAAVALSGGEDEPVEDPTPSQTTRDRAPRTPDDTVSEEPSPTQETPEETPTTQEPEPTPTETTEPTPTETTEPTPTETTETTEPTPTETATSNGNGAASEPSDTATSSAPTTTTEEDQ
jgi:serine/threonine protein kinase